MECQCKIIEVESREPDIPGKYANVIEFCPLHAAAPDFLRALEFIRLQFIALQKKATIRGITKKHLENDAYTGQVECENAINLTKATGA